jgi:hypothetical protein
MNKAEIDRWMRHQAHLNRQASMPAVNWVLIASVLIAAAALALMILKLARAL